MVDFNTWLLAIPEVQKYIFEDIRNRAELALAWVYHEYATFQGYTQRDRPAVTAYDECLTGLLTGLLERPDQREGYKAVFPQHLRLRLCLRH